MAGYADALASVLYPNSAANSMYTLGGQGLAKVQLPTFESPWQNALANAMQGLGAAGLQAYGIYSTNKANAENAAAMIPEMSKMGVNVSPEVATGLSSENPQTRALALALTEQKMKAQEAAAAKQAEMDDFVRKERLKSGIELDEFEKKEKISKGSKGPQQNFDNESKLRGELEKPLGQFQTSTRIFGTMLDAAGKDDKTADISLISGIAKLRDPESAVMQGEFNINTDVPSWIEKQFGNVRAEIEGKGRLQPETRAKILAAAQDYWENSRMQYEFAAAPRVEMARRQEMNPENVLMVPYERSAYESILSKMPRVGAPAASPTMPPAIAGPSPDGSTVRMALPPADNVALPYNLPPLPPDQEYRMTVDGLVRVRK